MMRTVWDPDSVTTRTELETAENQDQYGKLREKQGGRRECRKMYKYKDYRSAVGKIILCSYGDALTALFFEGQKYADRYTDRYLRGTYCPEGNPVLDRTHAWLDRYFAGERPDPSEIRLAPEGTQFQRKRMERWPAGSIPAARLSAARWAATPSPSSSPATACLARTAA